VSVVVLIFGSSVTARNAFAVFSVARRFWSASVSPTLERLL